ncbi:MAG: hypothetical protein P8R54_05420 [Myxococcota bacterium]|nr:hypothetical protein [Myxococcota bacterium]
MWLVPLSALSMLPSPEHHQLSIGPYVAAVQSGPVPIPDRSTASLQGVELSYLRFSEEDSEKGSLLSGRFANNTEAFSARIGIDQAGYIKLDRLQADSMLASVRVRRNLGDRLDLSIIGGHWIGSRRLAEGPRYRLTALVPSNLTLLGLSNTDQDDDEKLKYYISIGSGLGGEFIGQVVGPIGVYGRVLIKSTAQNRHRRDERNTVRNEVMLEPQLGLSYLGTGGTLILSGWGEVTTQWEPRDSDGRSGVDRQYIAGGLRLSGRLGMGGAPEVDDPIHASL